MLSGSSAVERLDLLTRRLRKECPWDQQQDERSIVPHTLEEAYELADAANSGDDSKLLDELGDVLFQVVFLSLLMEERGVGSLAEVAGHCHDKLVHRHPHVFTELEVESVAEIKSNWDKIKQQEPGREADVFGDVPENLPALLYARKLQRRALTRTEHVRTPESDLERLGSSASRLQGSESRSEEAFTAVGELLFAAVSLAREFEVDPELALRAVSKNFQKELSS